MSSRSTRMLFVTLLDGDASLAWVSRLTLLLAFCAIPVGVTAAPVLTSSPGYVITWDGNEGQHLNAPVPSNLARASAGAVAFSDGELGSITACRGGSHSTAWLNDGVYGNCSAWISDDDPASFAGIDLAGDALYALTAVAFGRDNNDITDITYTDRWIGMYTLQYTTTSAPGASTPDANWITIGTIELASSPGFNGHRRHQFAIATTAGGGIEATGFRILLPQGNALDEIELYGSRVSTVPEPGSLALVGLAIGIGMCRRSRRARNSDGGRRNEL